MARQRDRPPSIPARIVRFYGKISYSFYLLHPLTLVVLWQSQPALGRMITAGMTPSVVTIVLFIASVIAITPLAWLQTRLIERYGIIAGQKLTRLAASAERFIGASDQPPGGLSSQKRAHP